MIGLQVCLSDISKLPQEGTTSKEAWKTMVYRTIIIGIISSFMHVEIFF